MNDLNSFHIYLHSTGIEPWALDSHARSGLYQWIVSQPCFALFCRARAACRLYAASEFYCAFAKIDFTSRNFFKKMKWLLINKF